MKPGADNKKSSRGIHVQEDTVKSEQAVGNHRDQKEDLDGYDERILKITDHILIGHQAGRHAAHVMINDKVQNEYEEQKRSSSDLEQPGPCVFARTRPGST
jgi:hypothetical protein